MRSLLSLDEVFIEAVVFMEGGLRVLVIERIQCLQRVSEYSGRLEHERHLRVECWNRASTRRFRVDDTRARLRFRSDGLFIFGFSSTLL